MAKTDLSILLVTDKASFQDAIGFDLLQVATILRDGSPTVTATVTTVAHRSCDSGKCQGADESNFTFDKSNLTNIDEVWLFGFKLESEGSLDPNEVEAIAQFMEDGGGVFATGDHGSMGFALCGDIPRVRSMRHWSFKKQSPPGMTKNPISTLIGDEYSDAKPQTINPRRFRSQYDWPFAPRNFVHPLLSGPLGSITVLPDHDHEGLVEIIEDLFGDFPESNGQAMSPEIIADATDQHTGNCFGAIGVFDGHSADCPIGRIVVDSTWHHFINKNLHQFRIHYEHVIDAWENGTTPDPVSLPIAVDYFQMRSYFVNIARWLAPPGKQTYLWKRLLLALLQDSTIQMVLLSEEELPQDREERFLYYLDLGAKARLILRRVTSDQDFWSIVKRLAQRLGDFAQHVDEKSGLDTVDNFGPRSSFSLSPRVDPELGACVGVGGALHALGQLEFDPEATTDSTVQPEDQEGFELGILSALSTIGPGLGVDLAKLASAVGGATG